VKVEKGSRKVKVEKGKKSESGEVNESRGGEGAR
jgi:hypothetical protein